MTLLSKPSVSSAVRSLEKALVELEKAESTHRAEAEAHYEAADKAAVLALQETKAADRSQRIRAKLSDLLA